MRRTPVTLDDKRVGEARKALGAAPRPEAIPMALTEAVRRRRLQEALKHRGRIVLGACLDELRRLRAEG